jgi:hypothetical protein
MAELFTTYPRNRHQPLDSPGSWVIRRVSEIPTSLRNIPFIPIATAFSVRCFSNYSYKQAVAHAHHNPGGCSTIRHSLCSNCRVCRARTHQSGASYQQVVHNCRTSGPHGGGEADLWQPALVTAREFAWFRGSGVYGKTPRLCRAATAIRTGLDRRIGHSPSSGRTVSNRKTFSRLAGNHVFPPIMDALSVLLPGSVLRRRALGKMPFNSLDTGSPIGYTTHVSRP